VAKVCALAAPAPGAAVSTSAASRARLIADSVLSLVSMERRQSGQNRRGGKGWSVRDLPELHSPGFVHGELDEKVLAPARGGIGSYGLRAAGDRYASGSCERRGDSRRIQLAGPTTRRRRDVRRNRDELRDATGARDRRRG